MSDMDLIQIPTSYIFYFAAIIAFVFIRYQMTRATLLIVVPKAGCMPESKNLLEYLEGSFAKWQLPDGVVYEEELPFTATGKVSKLSLRKKYEDFNFKKGKNVK